MFDPVAGDGYVVANAGLKALGMDHGDPLWPEGQVMFCSDEHITLVPSPEKAVELDQRIRLVPAHLDPTVARHETMWLVDGTEVVDEFPVDLEALVMARREITNWSQLQRFQPREIFTPRSEDELAAIVARADAEGRRIKVMGAGHSFTAIAVTPDFHVTIHALDQLHHVDPSTGLVTVGAGITLKKLNRELDRYGLALTNMGDIDNSRLPAR